MPKPRVRSPEVTEQELSIMSGGGAPAAPERIVQTVIERRQEKSEPKIPASAVQLFSTRFPPELYEQIYAAAKGGTLKVSMNAWIVAACREKLLRDGH